MYQQLETPALRKDLQNALQVQSEEARLRYFCDVTDERHVYHIYSDAFKSVSFEFIYHPRPRYNESEEKIRINLQKILRVTTGLLMYNWFRFTLQSAPGRAPIEKNGNGPGRLRVKASLENTF